MPPQSSSVAKARYAFDGIRAQIRDLHTDTIANLALRARELGDVIALWYGEGDMVTPAFIRDAAKAALDEGLTFYIPNMRGHGPLNEALSDYQTRMHGQHIPIARTTVTPGGMQALYFALELLVDTGTNVVYIAPQWQNIHNAIHLIGGEPRPFALDFDGDWRLDLDRLFAACDARTRAIFLSTPANPTGWTATREELRALLEFSRRTGIWIISDEVYGRLYFDGDRGAFGPAGRRRRRPRAVGQQLLQGLGDDRLAHRLADASLGRRRPARRDDAICQQRHVGSGPGRRGGRHPPGRAAGPARSGSASRPASTSPMTGWPQIPGIVLPEKPRGGMYAFFALEGESDARRVCADILEKARVGLAPGHLFGQSGKAFMRMCVCRDRAADCNGAGSHA